MGKRESETQAQREYFRRYRQEREYDKVSPAQVEAGKRRHRIELMNEDKELIEATKEVWG